jgi:uncharacterized repeat protein (TIGR03803 family)
MLQEAEHMRISYLGRYALSVYAAAMLAGCGGGSNTPLSPSPAGVTAKRTHARPAYSVLYGFKGGKEDGAHPEAGLLSVKGTIYGTTYNGATRCTRGRPRCGSVFAITTSGKEAVLYSFKGYPDDGEYPTAGLINVNGTLYGTTPFGGANCGPSSGCGTVFSVTSSGAETVLHSFGGSGDGAYPTGLINFKGTLYGTTHGGGAYSCGNNGNCGTVFSMTPSGTETVLYSFGAGSRDGEYPAAGLTTLNGALYGTTFEGGQNGEGTVFKMSTSGTERVLYSFKGGKRDGESPEAPLVALHGTLYGTTYYGGGTGCALGCGAVFSITTSGKETVLYSFKGYPDDGEYPTAGLIAVNGTLYGTTSGGGYSSGCEFGQGCGIVFSVTSSGTETVLHSFGGSGDGGDPEAGLIDVDGTLYGTTNAGGYSSGDSRDGADCVYYTYGNFGCGTVFSLKP